MLKDQCLQCVHRPLRPPLKCQLSWPLDKKVELGIGGGDDDDKGLYISVPAID